MRRYLYTQAMPLLATLASFFFLLAIVVGLGGCSLKLDDLEAPAPAPEQTAQPVQQWLKWQAFHCSKAGRGAKLEFHAITGVARCMGSLAGEPAREIWQVKYPQTAQ